MPELPEVHTTATILHTLICNKKIVDVWSDYKSDHYLGKESIKDPSYFKKFKKEIIGKKIIKVWRRAKNVLIDIETNKTILIHMKMTGHLLYGKYSFKKSKKEWAANEPGSLQNPFNRFIHFVITFSDGTHLAFSDMRKFATVTLLKDKESLEAKFKTTGLEPLDSKFNWKVFKTCLSRKPKQKIKPALMDQSLVVGIGNIYSDEILWASYIHPERTVSTITDPEYKLLTKNTKNILTKGINFGGDSMSDYRNPYGEPGEFQLHHNAYRRTGQKCKRKECIGIIQRKVIQGRSAHFCNVCQK
jgi:formamidopyrimidine-DNA glycosylase